MSARCLGAWGGHEPPKATRRDGLPQGLPFAHGAANLLFASEVIKMDGVSMSETVTAHAVRVGEKSQEPDGASVRSMDGLRGGSAARSTLSLEIGKPLGSQKSQQNKVISGRPASAAGRSSQGRHARRSLGEVGSAFIPILPADISAGHGPVSAFHFLGSKTDPILHVQYPSPWNLIADFAAQSGENRKNSNWRCLLTLVGTAILTSSEYTTRNRVTIQGDPDARFGQREAGTCAHHILTA